MPSPQPLMNSDNYPMVCIHVPSNQVFDCSGGEYKNGEFLVELSKNRKSIMYLQCPIKFENSTLIDDQYFIYKGDITGALEALKSINKKLTRTPVMINGYKTYSKALQPV